MKIWRVWRLDRVGYDENVGFIIRAETADTARLMAWEKASQMPGESPNTWTDPARSSCEDLALDGEDEILSVSYYHG